MDAIAKRVYHIYGEWFLAWGQTGHLCFGDFYMLYFLFQFYYWIEIEKM
ncbi:hypothetical protein JCM19314_3412 [Nonlabens ulvanivorans]|uniref:Uncharacterized protein n=1 Tax=Nonlabens ulvanivorans TaxID=906888 RepID=A0A090QAX3_NONUL|nr:hypothetical protein JCM19314_3412 [Nonlabens ulvanivorans]